MIFSPLIPPIIPPINVLQILEQYGMLIVTGALVVVTFFYFLANQQMANWMKREFLLRVTPAIEITFLRMEVESLFYKYHFLVIN